MTHSEENAKFQISGSFDSLSVTLLATDDAHTLGLLHFADPPSLPAQLTQGTEVLVKARGRVVRTEKKRGDGAERVGVAGNIHWMGMVVGKVEIV